MISVGCYSGERHAYDLVCCYSHACSLHRCVSLLKEHYHGVSNVEADIAAIIVCDGVTSFLYHETVPVSLKLFVELLLDLSCDV